LLDIASGVVSSDIPRVHAFNVIRVIFADRDLTMDTTPYAARGVQVCIDAFSSPTWEVRPLLSRAFVLAFSPRHAGGIVACALALRLGAWLVPQQHSRSSNKERPRAPAGVWKLELNIRLSMFADQTFRLTFASTML
jgi:hypothetical protein